MTSKLFKNSLEEKYFYNLLAIRKYKEKENTIESYNQDINSYLKKCEEIFSANNAEYNYIEKLLSPGADALEVREDFTNYLKDLSLNTKEDLEFNSKRIEDRIERIEKTDDELKLILEFYPEIKEFDKEGTKNHLSEIFSEISSVIGVNHKEDIPVKIDIKVDSAETLVSGIRKVTKDLFEIQDLFNLEFDYQDLFTEKEDDNELEEDNEIEEDNELFESSLDTIEEEPLEEIQVDESILSDDFSYVEEEDNDQLTDLNDDIFITNTNFSLNDLSNEEEHIPLEEEEEEVETILETEDTVSFKMPKGFSLVDVSIALCDDESGWVNIFSVNDEMFKDIVNDKKGGDFKDIELDNKVFSGLTIQIPTLFDKNLERSSLGI